VGDPSVWDGRLRTKPGRLPSQQALKASYLTITRESLERHGSSGGG
jgi:hypothetical protein